MQQRKKKRSVAVLVPLKFHFEDAESVMSNLGDDFFPHTLRNKGSKRVLPEGLGSTEKSRRRGIELRKKKSSL